MTDNKPPIDSAAAFERAVAASSQEQRYLLRLFVTGMTPRSTEAVAAIKTICEQHLKGRYDLEVTIFTSIRSLQRTPKSSPRRRSSKSCRSPCGV